MRIVNILQVKNLGQGGQSGDQTVSTVPIGEQRAKELSRVLQIRIKGFCDKWATGHDFEHRVINQDTDTSTHLADFSLKEKEVDDCINLSIYGLYNPERDKYGLRVEVEPEGIYLHDSSRRIHGDILLKEFLD